jgi:flavodoxin
MSKTLIAFYSRAGENYFGSAMRHIAVGNTKVAAEMLQEITKGDLFEIEQVEPYSDSYMTCIEEAKRDLEANARPAVKT